MFGKVKEKLFVILGMVSMLFMTATTQAALTAADVAPLTTEVTDNIAVLLPYAIGILVLVLGATIAIGLLKKITNKVTS